MGAALAASDPRLLSQLRSIITVPETLKPPSLDHIAFLVPGIAGNPIGSASAPARASDASTHGGGAVAALLLGLCLLLNALYLLSRWRGRPLRRLIQRCTWTPRHRLGAFPSPLAALLLLLAAAALSAQLVSGASAPQPQAPKAATVAVTNSDLDGVSIQSGDEANLSRHRSGGTRIVQPAALSSLEAVERRVLEGRRHVVAIQTSIQQQASAPTPAMPANTRPAADLTQALAEERAAQAAYEKALADEYGYFAGLSRDPAQRAAVVGAVQQLHDPAASAALLHDLQVIDTYQAQESAIRSAGGDGLCTTLPGGQGQSLPAAVSAPISQGFGPSSFGLEPPMTYDGVFYPHFHSGIDLVAADPGGGRSRWSCHPRRPEHQ